MTRHQFTVRERLRYRFDNILGRGTSGMVMLLFSFAFLFLLAAALVITVLRLRTSDDQTLSFGEALWQSMLRAIDAGTIGGDNPWPFRIASLVITVMGIFVVSALIGILASGLDSRLTALQRGRGRIAVAGHTLILGWSPKVITIIRELAIAAESTRGATVVVLANHEKQEMDELIAARLSGQALRGLSVVTRTGQPSEPTDVAIVNPDLATSIIVVSDPVAAGDAGVIKTVLGLLGDGVETGIPIIAEIATPARAQALRSVTGRQVCIVEPGEIIARAAAQSSRETGLNLVLQELFGFDGSEIYFTHQAAATGQQFGDVVNCLERCALIGLRTPDGRVFINPPASTPVGAQDQLIVIAEDDSTIAWTGPASTTPLRPAPAGDDAPRSPETLVMFGWNEYGRAIVGHLDSYVSPGSRLTIVVDPDLVEASAIRLPQDPRNLTTTAMEIDDSEDPVGTALREIECDHILILCYRHDDLSFDEAESRALTTFLEVRATLASLGRQANVTAELLDERDVALIPSASAGEFMVSEKLASLMIAQLSQNAELQVVFEELLDPEGSEIYCKPVERYCVPGETVVFGRLVEAAKAHGELAIGWRIDRLATDRAHGFGVVINPTKSESVTFEEGDQLVVVAQEDA